ncbi:hypothetical protein J6590_090022 [Homalodisca vitripennis]|nr:hypothetical protein J6590_090022 [Homalodisca vitripennis]
MLVHLKGNQYAISLREHWTHCMEGGLRFICLQYYNYVAANTAIVKRAQDPLHGRGIEIYLFTLLQLCGSEHRGAPAQCIGFVVHFERLSLREHRTHCMEEELRFICLHYYNYVAANTVAPLHSVLALSSILKGNQ